MSQQSPQIQIITRVASLPLVHSALGFATDSYGKVKGYNGFITTAFDKAEQSILYVAESARPVYNRFGKPLTYADGIACQGLDKLQEKVPMIKKNPQEFVDESKKWYNNGLNRFEDIKKSGTDRVKGVKDYGVNKVQESINNILNTPYFQALLKSVDNAIELTENTVDHYLPPASNESTADPKQQNLVVRMAHLSEKMRKRVYENILSKYVPFVIVAISNFKATVLVWLVPHGGAQPQASN